jgi:methyltransferase (TIGR00027 family)
VISNVSDTARWVAVYRAWETQRPDALFRDPYARALAGERGLAMVKVMPRGASNGWPIILRTKIIDDLILQCVAEDCDCVVNLAAGLDTRPYRLMLPPSLLWVEADLPAVLAEKEKVLGTASAVCRLARHPVDLANAAARAEFLDEVQQQARRVLVLTEGLLVYLDDALVRELAADLHQRTAIRWWGLDLSSPGLVRMLAQSMSAALANAPMKFGPENGVKFFEDCGWQVGEIRSVNAEAARLKRTPFMLRVVTALFPQPNPRRPGNSRWYGVVRLHR